MNCVSSFRSAHHGNADVVAPSIVFCKLRQCLRCGRPAGRQACGRSCTRLDGEASEGDREIESVMDGTVERIGNRTLRHRAVAGIMIVIKLRCTETKIVLFCLGCIRLFLIINFEIVLCGGGGVGGWEGDKKKNSKCWYCESMNSWP
jgi:hypothetical protein